MTKYHLKNKLHVILILWLFINYYNKNFRNIFYLFNLSIDHIILSFYGHYLLMYFIIWSIYFLASNVANQDNWNQKLELELK